MLLVVSSVTFLLLGGVLVGLSGLFGGLLLLRADGGSGSSSSGGFGAACAAVLGLVVGVVRRGCCGPEEVNDHGADDGCSSEADSVVVGDRGARHSSYE